MPSEKASRDAHLGLILELLHRWRNGNGEWLQDPQWILLVDMLWSYLPTYIPWNHAYTNCSLNRSPKGGFSDHSSVTVRRHRRPFFLFLGFGSCYLGDGVHGAVGEEWLHSVLTGQLSPCQLVVTTCSFQRPAAAMPRGPWPFSTVPHHSWVRSRVQVTRQQLVKLFVLDRNE